MMRRGILPACGAFFVVLATLARGEGPAIGPEPVPVPVGVAVVDITPDYPIRLIGYGNRTAESEGISSRLKARALAIGGDDAEGGPAIVMAMDNLTIGSRMSEEVAARLAKKRGIRRERVVICATHTHCAPAVNNYRADILFGAEVPEDQLARIERYSGELTDALEKVALAALDDRAPALLSWGRGSVGFAGNRRVLKEGKWVGFGLNPNGPVDHGLPVLRVSDPAGKVRAVLFGYACHCTSVPGSYNQISGDWAGYACEEIERQHPGALALATIGCGADSGPQPSGKMEYAQENGKKLADEVGRLLKGPLRPLPGRIEARFRQIDLPMGPLPGRAEFRQRASRPGAEGYLARIFLGQLDRGEALPTTIPYPVRTWCFGDDLAMVFLGGEVVVDYALRLAWETDKDRLWVTSYSEDVRCYIPSRRVLSEGGYEADFNMILLGHPTRLAPETEDLIVRTVHELLPPPFDGPRAR